MNAHLKKSPLRILLVDDHAVVRVGLRNLIDDKPDLCVVSEAKSCVEAIQAVKGSGPDVILLDLRLPDGSGIDIIGTLKWAAPRAKVLILTSFADDTLLLAALRAGADGYILKDVAEPDLIEAIRRLASTEVLELRPDPVSRVGDAPVQNGYPSSTLDPLTGQERRVFELVGRGHSTREVAQSIGLTEKTVRNYLSRVFEKVGVRRRSQLVALYLSDKPWRSRPPRTGS